MTTMDEQEKLFLQGKNECLELLAATQALFESFAGCDPTIDPPRDRFSVCVEHWAKLCRIMGKVNSLP